MCRFKLGFWLFLLSVLQHSNLSAGRKCVVNNMVGNCELFFNCPHVLEDIRRAGGPSSIYSQNELRALSCGYTINNIPTVCCVPPHNIDTAYTRPPYRQELPLQGNQARDKILWDSTNNDNTHRPFNIDTDNKIPGNNKPGNDAVGDRLPDIQNHPNLRLLPTSCGAIDGTDRIVGGNQTQLFEMPWMVLLMYDTGLGIEPKCDGTLINEWYVLTAAHCVTSLPSEYTLKSVVLGEYDMRQDPDCQKFGGELICAPKIKTVRCEEVIPHEDYNPHSLFDDIALIRLSEPADFSLDSMKPICLPLTQELQKQKLVGSYAFVAGWGVTETGIQSPVLLSVNVPVVSKEDCQATYNGSAIISDKQLCAGGVEGRDSCSGDSGGPLMEPGRLGPGRFKYIQRGIVSFGTTQCGTSGYPGVYTNIAYYMDWILDHMHD